MTAAMERILLHSTVFCLVHMYVITILLHVSNLQYMQLFRYYWIKKVRGGEIIMSVILDDVLPKQQQLPNASSYNLILQDG